MGVWPVMITCWVWHHQVKVTVMEHACDKKKRMPGKPNRWVTWWILVQCYFQWSHLWKSDASRSLFYSCIEALVDLFVFIYGCFHRGAFRRSAKESTCRKTRSCSPRRALLVCTNIHHHLCTLICHQSLFFWCVTQICVWRPGIHHERDYINKYYKCDLNCDFKTLNICGWHLQYKRTKMHQISVRNPSHGFLYCKRYKNKSKGKTIQHLFTNAAC